MYAPNSLLTFFWVLNNYHLLQLIWQLIMEGFVTSIILFNCYFKASTVELVMFLYSLPLRF